MEPQPLRGNVAGRARGSGDVIEPVLGIARAPTGSRERPAKIGDRLKIVDGSKFVDVGQHGLHALGLGLEAFEPQQRIELDQASTRAMQPVDFVRKRGVGIALKSIGDQEHHRALSEHPTRPQLVEAMQ